MLLSMSMIAGYLKAYHIDCHIKDDRMCILGLRFILDEQFTLLPDYAYIGPAAEFLGDPQFALSYIIICRESRILCRDCNYDQLLNDLLGCFDFFLQWEGRLLAAASDHKSVDTFKTIIAEAIEDPFEIVTVEGIPIATAEGSYPAENETWKAMQRNHDVSPEVIASPFFDERGTRQYDFTSTPKRYIFHVKDTTSFIAFYLCKQNERICAMLVYQKEIDQKETFLARRIEQLSLVVARYLVEAEEFVNQQSSYLPEYLVWRALMGGSAVAKESLQRLQADFPDEHKRLLLLQGTKRSDAAFHRALRQMAKNIAKTNVSFEYEEKIYVIIASGSLEVFVHEMRRYVAQNDLLIVSSGVFSQFSELSRQKRQIDFVVNHVRQMETCLKFEDYAYDYMIGILKKEISVNDFVHPLIRQLKEYDQANGAELTHTLGVVLESAMNMQVASNALHIHRNTLKYRMRKIKELTHIDLDNAKERDYVTLSFRLLEE